MIGKIIGSAVLQAAQVHNDSWNETMKEHNISVKAAAVQACAQHSIPEMADPVYYMLKYTWNDIIDWATSMKDKPKEPMGEEG